jgi:pimeloyl-ACP methyl ester carboxylesterase
MHITDVTAVLHYEDLRDVILVGHSYAGMVITGVMDRIPERIRHVIYLDAVVPSDGQSFLDCCHMPLSSLKVVDGMVMFPWIDATKPYPRDVPQPVKTLTEPVSYRNPAAKPLPVTYIWFNHPDYSAQNRAGAEKGMQRLHDERGWTIRKLDSDHLAERTHPRELAAMLEASVSDQNSPVQGQR